MLSISFAYTIEPLLKRRKTETRRAWADRHARAFENAYLWGEDVKAMDRSPRFGGKPIALIKIDSIWREPLGNMKPASLINEGNLWANTDEFIDHFIKGNPNKQLDRKTLIWVIRFHVEALTDFGNEVLSKIGGA